MTSAMQWMACPMALALLHALGWTLLHFLWQGTVVALAMWCGLSVVRSSQLRYGLSCAALGLMVLLPVFTFSKLAAEAEHGRGQLATLSLNIDADSAWDGSGRGHEPLSKRIAHGLDLAASWVPALWIAGVGFCLIRMGFGLNIARKIRASGGSDVSEDLLAMFEEVRVRLGIPKAIELLHSAVVQVPTVVGWLHPMVLIPVGCFTGMSTEQIGAILCHELAHVRRHDYAVSVLQSGVEALLFYHPAVWWVSKQIRQERECCCDAMAVECGGNVMAYARALSLLEERRDPVPAFALGADGGVLVMRIKRLLGAERQTPGSPLIPALMLVAIVAVTALYFARKVHAQTGSPAAISGAATRLIARVGATERQTQAGGEEAPALQGTAAKEESVTPETSPQSSSIPLVYQRWLNEDALWIITPEERAEFAKLTDDEERDAFIANFWRRRDAPGSAPDSYREAYYERIAYANQHFAGANRAGWRMDRGHIYIAMGEPDEIEAHPGGGVDGYPDEIWHYRSSGTDGGPRDLRFVDTCNCGNYTLSVDSTADIKRVTEARTSPPVKPHAGRVPVPNKVIAGLAESKVAPVYPALAKAAGIEGTVVLHAVISKTGSVESLQVVSGPPELAESAIDAVRKWRYRPYLLNGLATEVETTIKVNYSLNDSAQPRAKNLGTDKAGDLVRRIGGNVSAPRLIYQVEPEYTEQARKAKFMGVVLVGLVVDKKGRPEDVHIVRGVGLGLNDKAVQAIRQYRFKPATEEGRPVPVELNVEVNFKIF